MLAVFGFCRSWKGARRREYQVLLVVTAVVSWLALLSLAHFWDRYVVAFIPIVSIWAAKGAMDALAWVMLRRSSVTKHAMLRGATAVAAVMLAAWAGIGSTRVYWASHLSTTIDRTAGLWLHQYDRAPGTVLATFEYAPYYSGGTALELPYAVDPSSVLRFISAQHVRYIVLSNAPSENGYAPYEIGWVDQGIPDSRARLIWKQKDPTTGETVVIYRWNASTVNRDSGTRGKTS